MNLFCIPCAGGSAYMFHKIEEMLPECVTIRPLELPGRGTRFNETLLQCTSDIVDDLYEQLKDQLTEDYILLGFSMGGMLVYELCRRMKKQNLKMPKSVFVLGGRAPEVFSHTDYHQLDDESFKDKMIANNGIPEELIKNRELFDLYMPILRADFKICETYKRAEDVEKFEFDIHLINGIRDDIDRTHLEMWRKYCNHCTMDFVPGDHFFIHSNVYETAYAIKKNIRVA